MTGGLDSKECAHDVGDPRFDLWEDPLEKGMVIHSSILARRIHGQRSLAGPSPWGCKDLDTTEQLTLSSLLFPVTQWVYLS